MPPEENTLLENVTPTGNEQAQQPAAVSAETGTEQTAQQPTEATPQEKPKNDWVQRRIDQLTREKHEEKRQREAAEARLREIQPPQERTGEPMTGDQIRAEARRIVQQERFDEACNKVFDAGKSKFGAEWESSLKTFQMLGGASQDFLEAVTSMEHGHAVLHALGQDPDTAERVLSLPPLRMALELARIEAKASASEPTPKPQVSKAPAPITPVSGKSAPAEPAEFASTADYIAWKKRQKG